MNPIRQASTVLLAIFAVSTIAKSGAPFDRYEVGRRLRAFSATTRSPCSCP